MAKMTSKDYQKDTGKIEETKGGGFGKYKEGVGGGQSPNGSAKPGTHGHGVNSDHRKQNNDTMQARTDDGKFTYKSVNGQSIDPKYGPSRGKTVNPLLTGGKNGVMIDEVEEQFENKSGKYWQEYGKEWFKKGDERAFLRNSDTKKIVIKKAAVAIWDLAKEYNMVKGEFVESLSGDGASEESVWDESKSGRKGKPEQQAEQQALASGKSQMVVDPKTGGYKSADKPFKKKEKPMQAPAPAPQQPAPQPSSVVSQQQSEPKQSTPQPMASSDQESKQQQSLEQPQPKTEEFSENDIELATSDPKTFIAQNMGKIAEINNLASKKGLKINVDTLINQIKSGKIKSFDDLKAKLSSK